MKLRRSDYGEFVPVKDGDIIKYGGYQDSLKLRGVSKFYRDRSCVVTAFTNCYLYMYRPFEKFSLDEFNDYQYWFFKILKPKIYGIPSAKILDIKLNRLRKNYHINLKANFLYENFFIRKTIEEKARFIEEALNKDCPVIFFNWVSNKVKLMQHHGVTITEINKLEDDYQLTVSSWGRKYLISLREFSRQFRTYSGFVYFERMDI